MGSSLVILLGMLFSSFSFCGNPLGLTASNLLDEAYTKAYEAVFESDKPILPTAKKNAIGSRLNERSLGDQIFLAEDVDPSLKLNNVETTIYPDEGNTVLTKSEIYDIANPCSFYGHIKWETPGGFILPAVGLVLQVYENHILGDSVLSPEYAWTDGDGFYSIIFENYNDDKIDAYLRIFAGTNDFMVSREPLFGDFLAYYADSLTVPMFPLYHKMMDITIEYEDSDAYKAFFISQIMAYGRMAMDYYSNVDMSLGSMISVVYPGFFPSKKEERTAYVDGILINITRDDWCAIGSILHEYMHYALDKAGNLQISLWDYLENNPQHEPSLDNLEEKEDKEFARQFTYNEAVAETFPLIVYDLFPMDFDAIVNRIIYEGDDEDRKNEITEIAEGFTDIKNDIYYSETFAGDRKNKGEFQEDTLRCFFYNLTDEDDPNDSFKEDIDIGPEAFLDLVTMPGVYTFDGFLAKFWGEFPELAEASFELLGRCCIGPSYFYAITSNLLTVKPSFIWKGGGSESHPNNVFDIEFYSFDKREIFSFDDVEYVEENENLRYFLSVGEWETLKAAVVGEPYIFCRVVGYNDEQDVLTGPFPSTFQLLNLCAKVTLYPDTFDFDDSYPSDRIDSILHISDLDVSTSRLRCGFTQKEAINLCPRKEGEGTAYLHLTFSKTVHMANINMSYWSADERFLEDDVFEASIYVKEEGQWIRAIDLIEANLPTDRTLPKNIQIYSKTGFFELCFYVHFDKMTGYTDRNKGRISIFDMEFYYESE